MPLRRTLDLTDSQRHDLEQYRDHDPRPYVRERCAALLKIADGQSPHAVARHGLLKPRDPDTVYAWLHEYERLGIRSVWCFNTAASIGCVFDRRDELLERLQQAPGEEARQAVAPTPNGPPPSRWTLRGVRATFAWLRDYSLSGVWRVLHREGLHIRSAQVRQHSPDPSSVTKRDHLLDCLREAAAHPNEVVLVFLDEMGYYRWPAEGPTWAVAAPQPAPLTERDGPNNKQWRVIGALNALSGRVDYLDEDIIGREKVVRFYHQLAAAYPEARKLYVVQDNWSIHRHADVVDALVALPQIEPVWLPTYAPWLNPIEKVWRWLREQVLTLHRLAGDWDALRERVNAFLDQFAEGSHEVLQYVGLMGEGKLAQALNTS